MSFGGGKKKGKLAINVMHWTENMKKNEKDNSATPSNTPGLMDVVGFLQFMHK